MLGVICSFSTVNGASAQITRRTFSVTDSCWFTRSTAAASAFSAMYWMVSSIVRTTSLPGSPALVPELPPSGHKDFLE